MEPSASRRSGAVDELELWDLHHFRVYRFLFHLTGEGETAERLTQESFQEALLGIARGEEVDEALLYHTALRHWEEFRQQKRRWSWVPAWIRPTRQSASQTSNVSDTLARLEPVEAAVLLLADGEAMSTEHVAKATSLSPWEVREKLDRSREAFAEAHAGSQSAVALPRALQATDKPVIGVTFRRRAVRVRLRPPNWKALAVGVALAAMVLAAYGGANAASINRWLDLRETDQKALEDNAAADTEEGRLVTRKEAAELLGAPLLRPGYLPKGFKLQELRTLEGDLYVAVGQRYLNAETGIRVDIVQGRAIGGWRPSSTREVREVQSRMLVLNQDWNDQRLQIATYNTNWTSGPRLTEEELFRIAEGLK